LVAFLVSKKLTTASEWKDDLDRLSRRIEENDVTTTPTLTLPGMADNTAPTVLLPLDPEAVQRMTNLKERRAG